MADFTSDFWHWFIIVLVVASFVGMFWLILWMSERRPSEGPAEPMGHVWDEDLEELNNPLPSWWLVMFYVTLFFGILYLILYPGLGAISGVLGWTQVSQYEQEVERAETTFGPLYAKYSQESIPALARDAEAMKTAQRVYLNYCTVCHASDARGAPGFPNLRDADWLYGGDPAAIRASILNGRSGVMPAWKGALGEEGVENVIDYVLSLSGRRADPEAVRLGGEKYNQLCIACHAADGTGNPALGAPNLTDEIWLYGGSRKAIEASIADGRQGRMPAHKEFLGEAKSHLVAAYIYSLSADGAK